MRCVHSPLAYCGRSALSVAFVVVLATPLTGNGVRLCPQVPTSAWSQTTHRDRWWDPPLTDRGAHQAALAGQSLATMLKKRAAEGDAGAAGVAMVYASPLHRTVKTAEQVAMALEVPVTVVDGLCECALAMRGKDLSTYVAGAPWVGPGTGPVRAVLTAKRRRRRSLRCPGSTSCPTSGCGPTHPQV